MKKKQKKKKNQPEKNNSQIQSQQNESQEFTTASQKENTQKKKQTTTSHTNDIKIKQVNAEIPSININKDTGDNGKDTDEINKIPESEIPDIKGISEETAPQAITPEAAGFIWELVFNKIADSKGEYWRLQKSEKETLANLSVSVANKYLNEIFSQYPDVAGLIIALVIVVAPRFMQLKKEHKKENEIKPEDRELDDEADKSLSTK